MIQNGKKMSSFSNGLASTVMGWEGVCFYFNTNCSGNQPFLNQSIK